MRTLHGGHRMIRRDSMRRPLTAKDLEGFNAGRDARAFDKLGSFPEGDGAWFAVWAPDAASIEVVGDWNDWRGGDDARLGPLEHTGVWQGFVRGAVRGQRYKYRVHSRHDGYVVDKADPYARLHEVAPGTASHVWQLAEFGWGDDAWAKSRAKKQSLDAPMSIYEVHLGSWRRVESEGNRSLGYKEIAKPLADHVEKLGFTHVELLPIAEHPFFGSWGYQVTGYFAPTHRFGKPEDFMFLVDHLHRRGIGVIVDWVPSHFPADEHGLVYFDGSHLYEHADPRQGRHAEWSSQCFNYGRHEVKSFLLSSAMYWLDAFHVDALRVDGVASMLFVDYARKPGEWVPNARGGRENLEAVDLLRTLNESIYLAHPDAQTIAEESTTWPRVSKPVSMGGLGFGFKWDMGWMHDTLAYFARDPIHRGHHHEEITFRSMYAYSENFVMPLSHDEVVYGKGSLYGKMPGDDWQKRANVRLLLSYMWSQPGKKLLFMGSELAMPAEWNHDGSLPWHLLDDPNHAGIAHMIGALNTHYRNEPALHDGDADASGFAWIDGTNTTESVIVYARKSHADETIVVALNFTPVPRTNYRIGVPRAGKWRELFNSDAKEYGGAGWGNLGGVDTAPVPWDGRRQSIAVTLPPLGAVFFTSRA
ncbi:MAG TPA: 1,4-alpha-glucan branching protein GlgB [Labilithrix sp.]